MHVLSHLRGLWGRWWLLPLLPLLAIPAFAALGQLRIEVLIIILVITGCGVGTKTSKGFLIAAIPGIAVGLGYEIVRLLRPIFVTADRVHGCDLRAVELSLFPAGDNLTWPDFFAIHHAAGWDVFFAVPYTAFWMIALGYGAFLFFTDRPGMTRYLWTLAGVHAVAFVIWLAFPAAPPWYIQAHGCGIDINALPNAAGLTRIDALFGIHYFADFYSRAPTVFGAMPSLHCAFPMIGLVAAWQSAGLRERMVHLAYVLWMLSASVYLDHHWLLDGLAGIALVLLVYLAIVRVLPKSDRADRKTKHMA
jgi:inositol phosphorylceramide synthase catalytic subunit